MTYEEFSEAIAKIRLRNMSFKTYRGFGDAYFFTVEMLNVPDVNDPDGPPTSVGMTRPFVATDQTTQDLYDACFVAASALATHEVAEWFEVASSDATPCRMFDPHDSASRFYKVGRFA